MLVLGKPARLLTVTGSNNSTLLAKVNGSIIAILIALALVLEVMHLKM